MVVLITYDLNRPGQDYASLWEAIKGVSGTWWHRFTSVWLVETSMTPQQIVDHLRPHMDSNDELLVIRVTEDYKGYLQDSAWDWLKARRFS